MASPAENITNAITAYNRAVRGDDPAAKPIKSESKDEFADLVKGAIREAININERSENLSIQAINDQADLNQVVTAVAEADYAFAIRRTSIGKRWHASKKTALPTY